MPIEWPDRLDIGVALRFLEDAHAYGIEHPRLHRRRAVPLSRVPASPSRRRAAELGFRFDKIMTNGVWFRDAGAPAQDVLTRAARRRLHRQARPERGQVPRHPHRRSWPSSAGRPGEVFDRDNIVSLSYASRHPDQGLEPVRDAGRRSWTPSSNGRTLLGRYLLVSPDLTMTLNWNHLAPVERAEKLDGAWDGDWFEEDYCEGPGQALIVNPQGRGEAVLRLRVRPGPADDRQHPPRHASRRSSGEAAKHPYVGKVFREGLTAIRDEILARDPDALPGATSNHCFFCWYVLTRGLAAGVAGGGGQVGNWTGELVQLGVMQRR